MGLDVDAPQKSEVAMRTCPACGVSKSSAEFTATIDGETCRLAICAECRAEQSRRFHRERKRRRPRTGA